MSKEHFVRVKGGPLDGLEVEVRQSVEKIVMVGTDGMIHRYEAGEVLTEGSREIDILEPTGNEEDFDKEMIETLYKRE